jgi:hypothetical protein
MGIERTHSATGPVVAGLGAFHNQSLIFEASFSLLGLGWASSSNCYYSIGSTLLFGMGLNRG